MVSSKNTLEQIILGMYEWFLQNNRRVLGVEEIHVVVLNSVTLMPKSIANYLKQLKLLGFLELKGTGFFFTDRLIEKGKGLHEQKVSDLQPKPEKEKPKFVDETGLPKY